MRSGWRGRLRRSLLSTVLPLALITLGGITVTFAAYHLWWASGLSPYRLEDRQPGGSPALVRLPGQPEPIVPAATAEPLEDLRTQPASAADEDAAEMGVKAAGDADAEGKAGAFDREQRGVLAGQRSPAAIVTDSRTEAALRPTASGR